MTASRGGRDGRAVTRRSGGDDERDERAATAGARAGDDDYDGRDEYEDYDDEYEEEREDQEDRRAPARERRPRPGLTATDAATAALGHITGMTGKSAEGIVSVRPEDDGWVVGVELLDARHIPSSSDTLALYEVEIDGDGELRSYHRSARYSRARGSSEAS